MPLLVFQRDSSALLPMAILMLITSFPQVFAQSAGKPLQLPARYDEHRFFVEPVTTGRIKLNFFTDTGGGLFIFSDVVEHLKIPLVKVQENGQTLELVELPEFSGGASIPVPLGNRGRLFVLPSTRREQLSREWSGMLGQQWFADRVWTFDYLNKRLLLRLDGDLPEGKDEHRVRLGFRADSSGKRETHFPRIQVSIDGEALDLLFDTGASTELTEAALAVLKDKRPAIRATSFIAANIFEKWRKRHPEWRVIEGAENRSGEAMIEVPRIVVAGYTVGPVWFTRRPDKSFHEYMSQWMDRPIEGALGGNALCHFSGTIDYPRAIAVFEK